MVHFVRKKCSKNLKCQNVMKMLATLGEGKIFDLLRNETEKIRSSITQLTNLKKLTS